MGQSLNKEETRLKTFINWPSKFVSCEKLARNGFYQRWDGLDIVTCHFCNITLCAWEEGDIVSVEHRRYAKNCPFLENRGGTDNVSIEQLNYEADNESSDHETTGYDVCYNDEKDSHSLELCEYFGRLILYDIKDDMKINSLKGRECSTHIDCSSFQRTSCVKDLDDDKLRCLCGDNKAPVNGLCTATSKALRHICMDNIPCDEDLICAMENVTKTTGFNRNSNANNNFPQPQVKLCLCDVASGWVEDTKDMSCNGGIQLVTGIFIPLTSLLVGSILAKDRFH